MNVRKLWWLGASAVAAACVFGGVVVWRAARAAKDSRAAIESARTLPFAMRRLDRALPAVEPIAEAAEFADAALFGGNLYLTTPSALLEYDLAGTLRRRWRAGLELPAAALGQLAVATGRATPELWIATSGAGLVEFDGHAFQQMLPTDAAGRKVAALLPLRSGALLFGTPRGVLSYDGTTLAPFQPSLSGLPVSALAGDATSLWIGTSDRGVYHWHAGILDHFAEAEGLPDPQVTSLAAAGSHAFAGTPMGIAEFADGTFRRRLAEGFFASALLDRGDALLAGSQDEGVAAFPIAPRKPRLALNHRGTLAGAVRRLFQLNGMVVALTSAGLYGADGPDLSWKRLVEPQPSTLTDRNVSALAVDSTGRLWIGYFDRGLDVVANGTVRHFESDTLFCINRIAQNPADGSVAVATANGLVMFDATPAPRQMMRRAQGLAADHVTDISFDGGQMVAATPAGVTIVDTAGTRSVSGFHGLVNPHVYTVAQAGGDLLAGTLGGLTVMHDGAVKASYTTFNSRLKHNWITAIQRVGGDWFIGTYGAGVLRFSPNGEWDAFPEMRGSIVINPNAMLVTSARVYAGTMEQGLAIYDRTSGRWSMTTDGLPLANVTALAAAGGTIYIGTDNGLVRAAEQNLR
jgi:ligand-binding sensor domain-containing protein